MAIHRSFYDGRLRRTGLSILFVSLFPMVCAAQEAKDTASDKPGATTAPSTAPPNSPETPEQPPPEQPSPEPTAWDLVLQGKKLLKEKDGEQAIVKLQAALARADKDELTQDDRALVNYLLCLAAQRAKNSELALSAIRKSVEQAPKEADYQLELANLLFAEEKNQDAKRAVEEALRLGLSSEDDQKDAQNLLRKTKSAILHERFSFDLSATFGYDSNVIQGRQAETIGGVPTGTKTSTTTTRQAFLEQLRQRNKNLIEGLLSNYQNAITTNFATPVPSIAEWDLPVTVGLDLGGRLYGNDNTELWTGYRFTQIAMTSPAVDHEAYSLQEHVVPLRLQSQPKSWLLLRPRIEGFVNFSGLQSFSPFQGGLTAAFDALFLESRRWRTRLYAAYQLRRSIDRDYSYLDGHRTDAKLLQEVRLNPGGTVWGRGQLSYRFRADLSGVLEQSVDLQILTPRLETVSVGTYDYRTPLSYLGHELGTRWRLFLPKGFDLGLGFGVEFRNYLADTTATYTSIPFTFVCPTATTLPNCPSGTTVTVPRDSASIGLPGVRRRDMLFSVDFGLAVTLPHGFSIDATVAFFRNSSNIQNGIDNRNYNKLTALLSAYYSF